MRSLANRVAPLMLFLLIGLGCGPQQAGPPKGAWWTDAEATRPPVSLDAILGPSPESHWELPPASKEARWGVQREEQLGRDALAAEGTQTLLLKGRTVYSPGVEVTCLVRLAATEKRNSLSFALNVAKDISDPRDQGIRITLSGQHNRYDLSASAEVPYRSASLRFNLKPYPVVSPLLPEHIRAPLEEAMAAAPAVQDKWVLIRCQTGADWARVWVDGRLLLDVTEAQARAARDERRKKDLAVLSALTDPKAKEEKLKAFKEAKLQEPVLRTSGHLQASLSPGVRLAQITVRPIPAPPALFEPIALDGYVRDRELLGKPGTAVAALPFGETVLVDGIPFRFADRALTGGADHLDIGRSLLREGNMEGYHPSSSPRFAGASCLDPARIQLRIPNGRYDAMYVVAAFDEERDHIPLLSASFYRPDAGFAQVSEAQVPSYRAAPHSLPKVSHLREGIPGALPASETAAYPPEGVKPSGGTRFPVRLENGRGANLWLVKIPLKPEALASFSDIDVLEVELTKKVCQYRSYPDPFLYGWHQAGLPSGVHVYAVTLHRPEVEMTLEPTVFGHVWTAGQTPSYEIGLANRADKPRAVSLTIETQSYDGTEKTKQEKQVTIPAGKSASQRVAIAVKKFGIHSLRMTLFVVRPSGRIGSERAEARTTNVEDGERAWTEQRNFAHLAPDTRPAEWDGKGPRFGYWSYLGGHHTPSKEETIRLMRLAGARAPNHPANAWPVTPQWEWAGEEKLDIEKYNAYKRKAVEAIRKVQGDNPPFVTFYPEPHISRDLTCGNLPEYWGEPPYRYTEQEKKAIRVFFNTSKAAAEGVREAWPNTKILIPWGDPLFIVPLLREGFPKNLIDGSGLDMIGFERLPEQQLHQMSTHRLYMLREEFRKAGIENPILPYVEGIFVPTEPGACTVEEQANYYHRWTLLSLAYGITEFWSGWFAFDCGNYYGAEHYGGCGIQRRFPYCDPKPAYAHYATMTRMLAGARFARWLPTGSLATYCLRFDREKGGPAYALWTLRGKRPATLTLPKDGSVSITDSMDNATAAPSKGKAVTVMTSGSPIYVTGADEIVSVAVGSPDHSDAIEWTRNRNQQTWLSGPVERSAPIARTMPIASLGDGTWTLHRERDEVYETNNYDTRRYLGRMSGSIVTDSDRPGPAMAIHLERQEAERKLMPWYSVLKPIRPIAIPGKSAALGLWVKARSDWGRVVYALRDAKGERWLSVGAKDDWNCDDPHSWSSFCFDGWRYLRFEMPAHAPWDTFREFGTTWWRHAGGDGIVDLPLTLEKIIVERRTHILYVNDIQPTDPADALLGDLVAEYDTEADATEQAVAQSRLRMPLPLVVRASARSQPGYGLKAALQTNPIAKMAAENALPATRLKAVRDPDWGYDGTRCHVDFDEVAGAVEYQVWVAAHPDGSGAQPIGRIAKSGGLVEGLRPAIPLHLWVTYANADKQQSKPSNRLEVNLVDSFGQK